MYYIVVLFVIMQLARTEPVDYLLQNDRLDSLLFPTADAESTGPSEEKDIVYRPTWTNAADSEILSKDAAYPNINDGANSFYKIDDGDTLGEEFRRINQLNAVQSMYLSNYLMKVLQNPDGSWEIPVAVVNDPIEDIDDRSYFLEMDDTPVVQKRTRYYQRYPWKKKNSRYRPYSSMEYDPYTPCTPSKKDVFALLLALHDVRNGNKSRMVQFCNRRRPASSIYTNIRFLGRKK